MGLSGTLEAFPLSEVLRMLARSGQTGRLYAQSGVKEMRAYLVGGSLVVAWDGSDTSFGDELVDRGLIARDAWEDVAAGAVPCEQALMDGVSPLEFDRTVRDITIEGLAKMVDGRSGTFAFEDGATTALRLGTDLDLDAVLEGVADRLQEWRRLRAIVPDVSQPLEFCPAGPGETIEMSHAAWNLLVSLLPDESLEVLVQLTGRSSTSVIEDLVELLESDRVRIDGYVSPSVVEAAFEEEEKRPAGDGTEHLAYVGDDPLGGFGPIGWENELGAIPATDEDENEGDELPPLLGEADVSFLVEAGEEPDGFDFGLVGLDVAPNKGRNLLEKDNTWDAFADFLDAGEADPTPNPSGAPEPSPAVTEDMAPSVDSSGSEMEEPVPEPSESEPEGTVEVVEETEEPVVTEPAEEIPEESPSSADGYGPDAPPAEPGSRVVGPILDEEPGPSGSDDVETSVEEVEPTEAPGELGELASVLSHLGLGTTEEEGSEEDEVEDDGVVVIQPDATSVEEIFPYDDAEPATTPTVDEVADESVTDDSETDEDDEETPGGGLPGVLRRRSRGALARELRSLSD